MKKFIFLSMVFVLAIGTFAFAAERPSEVYSDISGKTIEEVYELRGSERFGEMAEKNGFYEEFKERMLQSKKEILDKKVEDGLMKRETADSYIKTIESHIEDCDGETLGLGREIGFNFGRQGDEDTGFGQGRSRGNKRNQDDERYQHNNSENGIGFGNGFGARNFE